MGLHIKVVAAGKRWGGGRSIFPRGGLCPPAKTTNNYGMRGKNVRAQAGEERRTEFF